MVGEGLVAPASGMWELGIIEKKGDSKERRFILRGIRFKAEIVPIQLGDPTTPSFRPGMARALRG